MIDRGAYYLGEGKYIISISSGAFSSGLSWVQGKKGQLKSKIQNFSNLYKADSYKIIHEYAKPTHSGGGTTFGRLDITFVLLDGQQIRYFDSKALKNNFKHNELTGETEISLMEYYDSSDFLSPVEGIYKSVGGAFTLGIKKYGRLFKAVVLKSYYQNWKTGELKIVFTETATNGVFSIVYYLTDKSKLELFGKINDSGILEILISSNYKHSFIKMYPVKSKVVEAKNNVSNEWKGNGSGIIISKSGYIVTNHHVINGANDIEVEFILDGDVKKFNAELIQSDKVNDLSIIKIVDVNFDGVNELSYNFKTRSSDVGTKIYTFGYPYALLGMGKEIKVTDGIISSKTGLDGDITTYQISAAIQGGNSGGPLFDDKGNFIGINSSGINAVNIENVGYSIKTSYVLNLIDVLPKSIELPSSRKLENIPLTEQIKEISKSVVLVKVK
jgi:S1-C subfamily serine protease